MENSKLILSLESSENTCGIALARNGEIIAEINYYSKNLHDRLLAEICRRTLQDFQYKFSDLSAVAISAGPGSFTGLRIASALVKGICFDNDIKFIAVPNSSAFAFAALELAEKLNKTSIISMIKSHNNAFYIQKFSTKDFSCDEIKMITYDALQNFIDNSSVFVGSAANLSESDFVLKEFTVAKVLFISYLAEKMFDNSEFTDAMNFEPMYVQDFVPKISTKELKF